MKLLVMLLCLLSERYLVHALSHQRFQWFASVVQRFFQSFSNLPWLNNSWVALSVVIIPIVILFGLALYLLDTVLFGLFALMIHLSVFYYCLGPTNPFYPIRETMTDASIEPQMVGAYLTEVNDSLFSVMFWYILLGPIGALVFRLVSLGQLIPPINLASQCLYGYLVWVPARITLFFYMLAGNFQKAWPFFKTAFLTKPGAEPSLLFEGGVLALSVENQQSATMPLAEALVEHALVIYLAFLAIFTLVAWL